MRPSPNALNQNGELCHCLCEMVFCSLLLTLPLFSYPRSNDQAKGAPSIRAEVELVDVPVVVTDRNGQRVAGLQREDFDIYEDDVRQEITHFAAEQEPLNLVLLFDLSVSMEAALPFVQKTAIKLVDTLRAEDEVIVLAFAQEIIAKTDWTKDRDQAKKRILELMPARPPWRNIPPNLSPGSLPDLNTNLYGALAYVFDAIGRHREHTVVLLFSDGVGSLDRYRFKERRLDEEAVLRRAEESWGPIYSACFESGSKGLPLGRLGPFDIRRSKPRGYGSGCKFLSRIGFATGGKVYEVKKEPGLDLALQETLADLRSRYSLAYKPPPGKPGFHSLRVLVKRPNLLPHYRKGYRRQGAN